MIHRRLSTLALIGVLSTGLLAASGCGKPGDKAQEIVNSGQLIGVTIAEAEQIVGKPATKHDEFNYYWDMGKGAGVIQVLVRGGKINRVDLEDHFNPREARGATPASSQPAPTGSGTDDSNGGG